MIRIIAEEPRHTGLAALPHRNIHNEDPTLLYDLYNGSVVSSFNFCQIKEPYKISCHNLDGNV